MRRKRGGREQQRDGGRGHAEAVPAAHRAAVAVLVVANLAAFAATLHCLRQLGQVDASNGYRQPDVDLAGLYEDAGASFAGAASAVDVADLYKDDFQPPNPGVPPAASPAAPAPPPGVPKDLFKLPPGATWPPAAPAAAPPVSAAIPQLPALVPTSAPVLGAPGQLPSEALPVLSAAARQQSTAAARACPPCSGQVRGPLPTTLRAAHPRATACQWTEHPKTYLSDMSADVDHRYDLTVAQEFCVELAGDCFGVTCESGRTRCSARAGRQVMSSPNAAETTYVKSCGDLFYSTAGRANSVEEATAGKCEGKEVPEGNPPGLEDLQNAAIVILAHSRGDALKSCLNSLLAQPEIKLFKMFVSLDLKEAVPTMTAVVQEAMKEFGVEIVIWEVERFVGDPSKHNKDQIAWFQFNAGKIAHHYWTALERTFVTNEFKNAIFLEEDLFTAPDFLALFRSTAWILEHDPSIWCVSAWNDVGMAASFSDQCRLLRTSYFPGLGFLLTKTAWTKLRLAWPTAPTMGWDYWMRVAFKREGKECIIPEISRTRHMIGAGGSSITNIKQFKLFRSMALAQLPSICSPEGQCAQFGDISYLLENKYSTWLSQAVQTLPKASVAEIRNGIQSGKSLDPKQTYVVPYIREEYTPLVEVLGLRPKGTKMAIPQDIRAEHYGLLHARHLQTRAHILLVDRRSPLGYLPENEQLRMSPSSIAVGGTKGQSCTATCQAKQMLCSERELHFVNNCHALEKQFGCEGGCAHQVGKELPVYVPDAMQPTYKQCLVTFISPLKCDSSHSATARLCACAAAGQR